MDQKNLLAAIHANRERWAEQQRVLNDRQARLVAASRAALGRSLDVLEEHEADRRVD